MCQNHRRCGALSALILALIAVVNAAYTETDILVHDRRIYVAGVEYYIKGMVYQPTPLGISKMNLNGTGGAGLCSPKLTPWNESKSACYDSDYYDSSKDTGRIPDGPENWFEALWRRDFPIMKKMGVNTLRLYSINPTNEYGSIKCLEEGLDNVAFPRGKNHIGFMNTAHEFGFKVIFPLITDESALSNDSDEALERKVRNIVEEVGNHSALLLWIAGNELDIRATSDDKMVKRLNQMMELARKITLERWGRHVPVTYCTNDIPDNYEFLAYNLNVDVFCTNSGYRGVDYSSFWNSVPNSKFMGWKKLSKATQLPILIGEIGSNTDMPQPWLSKNWFNLALKDIYGHESDGCIGLVYFEYNDEAYKPGNEKGYGVVSFVPHVEGELNSRDSVDYFHPDDVVIKQQIFDYICCGVVNQKSINFATDVCQYLNRTAYTLNLSEPLLTAADKEQNLTNTTSLDADMQNSSVNNIDGVNLNNSNSNDTELRKKYKIFSSSHANSHKTLLVSTLTTLLVVSIALLL